MFSVLFEVHPKGDQWDAYLGYAKLLRPELERVKGFVDNIRYRSLSREGWILSLSNWDDEKALVRWRTQAKHHGVQEKGREEVLLDYHLRVGQVTKDTKPPEGHALREQRLDETEVGEGTTIILIDTKQSKEWVEGHCREDVAQVAGPRSPGEGPCLVGRVRRRAHARRDRPALVLARSRGRRGLRGRLEIAGRGAIAPGPRGAGLRHVRTP